jgi:hypothetical protein
MRRFIPMTDELLYRAGGPPGRLVPYRTGLDCWHALGEDGIYRFNDEALDPSHSVQLRYAMDVAFTLPLAAPA